MHRLPLWYIAFTEFGYVFHSVIDLLFIVFGFLIVAVVSRPGWRHHLRWANPAAAASVLSGIDRLVRDLHHYLGIGTAINEYLASDLFNYGADILSFYSIFMLWRTLRDLARYPASPDPLAEHLPTPDLAEQSPAGVWPPPPVVR